MTRRLLVCVAVVTSACVPDDVVVEVNGRRLTVADVQATARLEQRPVASVLESVVSQEVLAAEARRIKLHEREDVRARLLAAEREILVQALLDHEATVDEKSLKARYGEPGAATVKQLELAHIFVALPTGGSPQALEAARNKVTTAWARVLGGEAFEAVAREVSEDRASGEKGGVVGVVREGAISRDVFAAAAELPAGGVSKPLQTAYGFYLLKALTPVTEVKLPWEEARGRLAVEAREAARVAVAKRAESNTRVRRFEKALARLGEGAR
jgi:parvulin-like peptidyl-prolyl isomerase